MSLVRFPCRWLLFVTSLSLASSALAHEFWIEPLDFYLETGEPVVANLKVGQDMKGDVYPYLPQRFIEFSISGPQGKRPVKERLGAIPAASEQALGSGLQVLAYHSTPSTVSYDSFEKFEKFLREENLTGIAEAHRKRGLPEVGFTEAFTRYAKALVQVGDGAGQNSPIGMPFELVAQTNPYADQGADELIVRLLWQGQGMADTQIKVFRKPAQGEVIVTKVMTDAEGRATIAIGEGGTYLLSAVHMIVPSKEVVRETYAVWQSLWASLTFHSIE